MSTPGFYKTNPRALSVRGVARMTSLFRLPMAYLITRFQTATPAGRMPTMWQDLECTKQDLSERFWQATARQRQDFASLGFIELGLKKAKEFLNPLIRDRGGINYLDATRNLGIRERVLEVCASALHEAGAEFVRYAWGDYPATVPLPSLARASAGCLPFREGFGRVVAALAQQDGSHKRDLILSLGYFHSPEALDWIEQHIFGPITEDWGYLAAASRLDWPRVEQWFERGRPLSLVAIDALAAIMRPQTPLLRAYGPRLHRPPSRARFIQVLSDYAARDKGPRVQQRTAGLISNADNDAFLPA
jgi:hypothetical protein